MKKKVVIRIIVQGINENADIFAQRLSDYVDKTARDLEHHVIDINFTSCAKGRQTANIVIVM